MFAQVLAAVLIAQAPVPAPTAPEPSVDDLGRGYYLFLEGQALEGEDVAQAIERYREAARLLPGAPPLHVALARLYAQRNDLDAAQREAEAALAVSPDDREAHRLLGSLLSVEVERSADPSPAALDAAIEHFERALAGNVDDPPIELALSALYLERHDETKGVAMLRDFLVEHPDYPPALRLLVRGLDAVGEREEAAAVRQALADVRPDTVQFRARQVDQLEQEGRWADAARDWAEIIDSDPGASIYRTRYAAALANSGSFQEAHRELLEATREAPRSVAGWYLLSLIEGRLGRADAAEEAAARIMDIDPEDARGPLALARARAALGDDRGVLEALNPRVASPLPADLSSGMYAQMVSELSGALTRLGQPKRAIAVLENARGQAPEDEDLLYTLAGTYERNQQYQLAEDAFRALIERNSSHAPALNYLGYMLAERGQKLPEAVDLIRRALAIDADNPAFLDSLGWAYFRMGQLDEAEDPLERAAAALPGVSVIQDHLGDLYLSLERYEEAAGAFDRALAGDRDGIDVPAITRKRDRALSLAGKS